MHHSGSSGDDSSSSGSENEHGSDAGGSISGGGNETAGESSGGETDEGEGGASSEGGESSNESGSGSSSIGGQASSGSAGESYPSGGETAEGGEENLGGEINESDGGSGSFGGETASDGGSAGEANGGATSVEENGGTSIVGNGGSESGGETVSVGGNPEGIGGEETGIGGRTTGNGGVTSNGGITHGLGGSVGEGGGSIGLGGRTLIGSGGMTQTGGAGSSGGATMSIGGSDTGGETASNGGSETGGTDTSVGGNGGTCSGDHWTMRSVGTEIQLYFGNYEYVTIQKTDSYTRFVYGPESVWATSIILSPSFWLASPTPDLSDSYYHSTGIETDTVVDCGKVTISFNGSHGGLDFEGTLQINSPASNQITAHVKMTASGTIALSEDRPGEKFKPVSLSSMYESSTQWDTSSAMIGTTLYTYPETIVDNCSVTPAPVSATRFGLVGGTSSWKTNAPTVIIETAELSESTVMGWIAHMTDPNEDNLGFWIATDYVPKSWSYDIIVNDSIAP